MSEKLLKDNVQDMLNEEKWTREAISSYSTAKFQELGAIVEKAKTENCIDDVKTVVDDHLAHTQNSIIALYLSGMLALKQKNLDDSNLVKLVNIFIDNKKQQVVTYLCNAILSEDENNKFALQTLAASYKEANDERVYEIYERLIKVDHNEAEIVKLLADKASNDGDTEKAIDYYKKALHRYVNQANSTQIKEIWSKLVALIPEEIDFFYHVQRKVAKTISEDKSALLLHELFDHYHDAKDWNTAIEILKLILSYDEKDSWAREKIIDCYRAKYEKHSKLEDYIRVSDLGQAWRNVFEAIADFEKHIAFDTKNFVFHRSWGVGIIREVKNDELIINFGKKFGVKSMSLKMAVNALQPLEKDHIWVLKATKSRDELAQMIKKDKAWALKTIIRSFNNDCDFKRIKAELVPSIFEAKEWTSWSTSARKVLEEDPTFGVNSNDINKYIVRDRAITAEEKLSIEFKAQKNFFARIDILMKFANDEETDKNSEQFTEMFAYFVNYLKSFSVVDEKIVAAYLVVRHIVAENPHLKEDFSYTFAELYNELENEDKNPRDIYTNLKDTKNTSLKKDFLRCIKDLLPNWVDEYIKLFPSVLQREVLDALLMSGSKDKLLQMVLNCFENYRDNREAVIFFFETCQEEEWFKELNLSYEKQLITLIRILDLAYREIENHYDTTENKKLEKKIINLLFKEDTLLTYMMANDLDTISRLITLVDDISGLDSTVRAKMRNRILEKYPDFKFYGTVEKVTQSKGTFVTAKMLEVKKEQLEHIKNVEIPENAKEIGEAMEKGDLKENAEYHAAKDKQKELAAILKRLENEINNAVIFDPSTVTTTFISFGTNVELYNENSAQKEVFTILGPWESNPEVGIISYLSPLGTQLQNKKEGETFAFTLNDQEFKYTVKSIKAAKF